MVVLHEIYEYAFNISLSKSLFWTLTVNMWCICFGTIHFCHLKLLLNLRHHLFPSVTCASGQTLVISRWQFTENAECGEIVGQITDFYDTNLRMECKIWLDLHEIPDKVEATSLYQCFRLRNGTTKYKMNVCCPGESIFVELIKGPSSIRCLFARLISNPFSKRAHM